MIRLPAIAALLFAVPATAQTAPTPAPVEHRLSAAEIAAAQADGEDRSRAAEQLAMTRGDPSLALPLGRPKTVHGEAGFGIGSNGAREVFGAVSTTVGDSAIATVAGDYTQFGSPYRLRQRTR